MSNIEKRVDAICDAHELEKSRLRYDYMTRRLANDDELYSGFKTERAKLALSEARAELAECANASRYAKETRMTLADHIRNLRLLADSNKRDKIRIAELKAEVEVWGRKP